MNRLPPACPIQLSLLIIIIIQPSSSSSSSVERSLRFGSAEGKAGCVNSLLPGLEEEAAPDCSPRPPAAQKTLVCAFFSVLFTFLGNLNF